MKKEVIGIDLGMSTTIISTFTIGNRKSPEIIPISDQNVIPTVIRLGDEPGSVAQYGTRALKEAADYPETTFFNFKSGIGTGETLQAPFGSFPVDDICMWFLKAICEDLVRVRYGSSSFGSGLIETRIGYPVHWPKKRREALCRIAAEAGFPKVDAIPEPLGVAVNYLARSGGAPQPAGSKTLIMDFGALTTDISIIEHKTEDVTIPKNIGGKDLGGVDVDRLIADRLEQILMDKTGRSELDRSEKKNLLLKAESMKRVLSADKEKATSRYADRQTHSFIDLRLEKDEFETMAGPFRRKLIDFIRLTVAGSDIEPLKISQVLLAGGMSRMYFTKKLVSTALPEIDADIILEDPDPQGVIAKGLAYSGVGLDQILKALRGRIDMEFDTAVERVKSQVLSKTLESKIALACRKALDAVWEDVSLTEIVRYKFSPFRDIKRCPSVKKIQEEVTGAIKGVLDPELNTVMTRFADEVQIGISRVLSEFQQDILNLSGADGSHSSDLAVNGAVNDSAGGIGGAIGTGIAATAGAVISSQMLWVTSWIISTVLNPVALAALIVASLIAILASAHTLKKCFSFKEKLHSKLITELGTREPHPKKKNDEGGLLYKMWYGRQGLAWRLEKIKESVWSGKQPDGTIIRNGNGERVPNLEAEVRKVFTDVSAPAVEG